jgi:predicted metal-dependent hydrolase
MPTAQPAGPDEAALLADPRFTEAISLFNAGQWYACHDVLEALWHETACPLRPVLQGLLQLAVSQLHRENGNLRGAVILLGEGLGRLRRAPFEVCGLELQSLCTIAAQHLVALQGLDPLATPEPAAEPLPPLLLRPARRD